MDKMIPLDVYSDTPNDTVNIENKQDDEQKIVHERCSEK